jgi:YidC/Oxa1 family membrane protein insertase
METNRNYFVAILLSVLVLIGWQYLYVSPKIEREREAAQALQAEQAATQPDATGAGTATPGAVSGSAPGGEAALPGVVAPETGLTREDALAQSERIAIDTPALSGSINLDRRAD